jgi:hypothetical protein
MKFIKLAIISLVVFSALIFLLSVLIPGHVRVSRAVNIQGRQEPVSEVLSNLAGWQEWNEFLKRTPPGKWRYHDHTLSGDSLTISLMLATADTVKTVWRSKSGREIAGVFALQQAGDVTIVQWYFDFHQPWYPWEKFNSINFDKQWAPFMEKSLDNLKKKMEHLQ